MSNIRLRMTPLWPALVALAAATLLLSWLLPGLLHRATAESLQDSLRLARPTIVANSHLQGRELQDWIRSLAEGGTSRITLIDASGRVLADSARTYDSMLAMDNHRQRPEIQAALRTGEGSSVRRSATTGRDYAYAALSFTDTRGQQMVLRLARPLEQMAQLRQRLAGIMAVAAIAGLLAMGIVSWRLDQFFFRPLTQVIEGAGVFASGGFQQRLKEPGQRHLARLVRILNRMGERVDDQLQALAAERDQLTDILASMTEGVLVTDSDGRAVLANAAFDDFFQLDGQIVGKLPLDISRQPQLEEVIRTALEGEMIADRRLESSRGLVLNLNASPLVASGGAVVVARDVTDEDRLLAMRRDFVANVSHELKTPLAAIRGFAETLRDGALDERDTAERFLDRILFQCRRLQRLLEDLLTLSRLETPEASAQELQPVDLAVLARQARELVHPSAEAKKVEVTIEEIPIPRVTGVRNDLERLLVNLLENAIKYNRPEGRVRLRLGTRGEQVQVEVIDTGIGISPQHLPRLFERFYRVDKGRSRSEGGTGLGLSIVKHVAQSHGGEVQVESTPSQGTTFRVLLPTAEDFAERSA